MNSTKLEITTSADASPELLELSALQAMHLVGQDLSLTPTKLNKTDQNARSFADTMRLSIAQYPTAYNATTKDFTPERAEELFWGRNVSVYVVGRERRILAGVVTSLALPLAWDEENDPRPHIEYLFRIHESHEPRLKRAGRRVLAHALDELLVEGRHCVGIDVLEDNTRALNLYRKIGFESATEARTLTINAFLLSLELRGKAKIEAARDMLHHGL